MRLANVGGSKWVDSAGPRVPIASLKSIKSLTVRPLTDVPHSLQSVGPTGGTV